MAQTKIKGVIMPVDATAFLVRMKPQPTVNEHGNLNWYKEGKGGLSNATLKDLNDILFGILDLAPYQPGDKIFVKEIWHLKGWVDGIANYAYKSDGGVCPTIIITDEFGEYQHNTWRSAYHMPIEAARHFKDVEKVEAVRCRDVSYAYCEQLLNYDYSEGMQWENYSNDWHKYHDDKMQFGDYRHSLESYIISRFGQTAWDNNEYFWLITVKTAEK